MVTWSLLPFAFHVNAMVNLSHLSMVDEANLLTKEGTKIGPPVPGEAGNCALGEVTGKLGPRQRKTGRSRRCSDQQG